MTALHIRANVAQILRSTAQVVESINIPAKQQVKDKMDEYRIRAAAILIPNSAQIHIDS